MADIHAVDYPINDEGDIVPPDNGLFSTQDYVFAAVCGTLNFEMRGRVPVAISFNGDRIASTLRQPGGSGNLKLCQTTFYFLVDGPRTIEHGQLYFQKVYAAYYLARLQQRQRRGDKSPDLEKLIARGNKMAHKHGVQTRLFEEVLGLIDMASNLFVLSETIEELAAQPFLTFARQLSRPGGLSHVVQPLNQESRVMDKAQRLHLHQKHR